MAAGLFKCCHCRDNIQVTDAAWVGQLSGTADCAVAPDGKHARQVVLNVKVAA